MVVQTQSSQAEQAASDPRLGRSWIKLTLLAVVIGVLLVIVYFSPFRQYLGDLRNLSQRIRSFGPLAPLVLVGSVALLVAVGFPRTVFCVLAGMTLGFWSGLLWAQLGTLVGNYILFLAVRTLGLDWGRRMLSKRANIRNLVRQRGALGVIFARQLPLPGLLINVACALLPIGQVDFLVGTLLGQLPQAVPWTLIGAGLLQTSLSKSIGVIGLAIAASLLAWLGVQYALRRSAVSLQPEGK
ncbi:MAG TPA: VTT domain-containing protein [Verrucomicrobiae bacterium]|nr:VTT domain-containing protein [Verrucomicrobiae bacterium]